MAETAPLTFLCITTYEKGQEFMRECKRHGCRVLLLTAETLREAAWPRESLDNIFYIPSNLPLTEIVNAVSYVAREQKIDRIVALNGRRPILEFDDWRVGDQRWYVSNHVKYTRVTGWQPGSDRAPSSRSCVPTRSATTCARSTRPRPHGWASRTCASTCRSGRLRRG